MATVYSTIYIRVRGDWHLPKYCMKFYEAFVYIYFLQLQKLFFRKKRSVKKNQINKLTKCKYYVKEFFSPGGGELIAVCKFLKGYGR